MTITPTLLFFKGGGGGATKSTDIALSSRESFLCLTISNGKSANAKQSTIGKLIDDAMLAIETSNASLKGILPKDYNRPALDRVMLGELIDLISGIAAALSSSTAQRCGEET